MYKKRQRKVRKALIPPSLKVRWCHKLILTDLNMDDRKARDVSAISNAIFQLDEGAFRSRALPAITASVSASGSHLFSDDNISSCWFGLWIDLYSYCHVAQTHGRPRVLSKWHLNCTLLLKPHNDVRYGNISSNKSSKNFQ